MAYYFKQYDLTNASVDRISGVVQEYMNKLGAERLTILRVRLTVEELLLHIREHTGEQIKGYVAVGKRFGQHVFRMFYKGASYNPIEFSENDWNEQIMASLGLKPAWNYIGGANTFSLPLAERATRSTVANIAAAVAAAVLVGVLGFRLIPLQGRQEAVQVFLSPLMDSFFGLIDTFSGLMIALTICSGILGVGDSVMLGKMGKKVILHQVRTLFVISAFCVAALLPLLRFSFSATPQGGTQWREISQMLFDILPTNPITPFEQGNSIQIIVIALFLGIGLLAIGERGKRLRSLVDEGATLTQHITTFICKFVPFLVFVMLLKQIWSGEARQLLSSWKPLALAVIGNLVMTVVLVLVAAVRLKCSPRLLIKKVLPTGLIAFSTASSMAAMTMGMNACEKKLGVDKSLVNFAYPLGTVVYMPGVSICFAVIVCTMAEIYHVNISVSWIFISVVTITLITVALPPIPGSGVMAYSILFARLGIPSDALLMATALELILDFVSTGTSVLLLCLKIAEEGKLQGLLNREALME